MELYQVKPNGCWIWTGSYNARGYPVYRGWLYPTRLIYLRVKGADSLPGLCIHGKTCKNKACVNPDHQKVRRGTKRTE